MLVNNRESLKKQEELKQKEEQEKLRKYQKLVSLRINKEKKQREDFSQAKAAFNQFYNSMKVQGVLSTYRRQLKHIYLYFARMDLSGCEQHILHCCQCNGFL